MLKISSPLSKLSAPCLNLVRKKSSSGFYIPGTASRKILVGLRPLNTYKPGDFIPKLNQRLKELFGDWAE